MTQPFICANCGKRSRRGFTPSQRMRFALWHMHAAQGGDEDTFPIFYADRMRQLTDMIWEKIEKIIKTEEPF